MSGVYNNKLKAEMMAKPETRQVPSEANGYAPPVQAIKDAVWFTDQALNDDAYSATSKKTAKRCLRELHKYLDRIGA